MKPITHFNLFCEKFSKLRTLSSEGKKGTFEYDTLLMEMVEHYWEFDQKMENYISKWNMELVNLNFFIKLHCPEWPQKYPLKSEHLKVQDIDVEYANEEVDNDCLIFRKDVAYKDGEEVTVANYCKHSTPWSLLGDNYQNELYKRTIENIKNELLGRVDPKAAKKKSLKGINRIPKKWTLPDNQRDW